MKEEDLGSTKPIKTLDEEKLSREEKYEDVLDDFLESREEKYQNRLEEEKAKEAEEEAEKALAQKNIELAEEYEAEEEKALEEEKEEVSEEVEEKKKEKPLVRLKKWWSSLDGSQKVIYGAIGVLVLLLFILLIVGAVALIGKGKKEEGPKQEEQMVIEDNAPVMFDNYYYKGGSLYFLGEGGKEIGSYECDNKSEKLCSVAVNNYRDVLDVPMVEGEDGESLTEYVGIVDENFVFVNDTAEGASPNIVLYSIKNNEKLGTYGDVKAYDGGYYAVSDTNGKYGLLQITNEAKTIIKHQYEYLGMIDGENYLIAKEKKGFIVIDKKDKGISSYINANEVKYYNNNFVVTKDNGLYSVYNFKAQQVATGYSFATVKNKYMFLITDKEMIVKDKDGNKFNEDPVTLVNGDYVKTYILDQDGGLVKTKRSFETEVKGNDINIAVYNVTYEEPQYKTLSILEGNLNKNYDFVNYFDGTLYFYKDAKKTELLGSYTCANKNELTAKSTEYTKCFIAKDTVYSDNDLTTDAIKKRKTLIPMFNKRYVFIKDENVILYDLISRETKSTYLTVNTNSGANDYKFVERSGSAKIIAVNRKGKYGVIKIDGANVTALHKFNYNRIEYLGNYLIGQDANNKWLMFDSGQEEGIFPGKINGYSKDLKYFKIRDENGYKVYTAAGEEAVKDAYAYVELYEGFYAGVKNKEVDIYNYDGKKLSAESVTVGNYPMSRTTTPAFKVKKNGSNGFIVSVYNGKAYVDHNVALKPAEPEQ